MSSYRTIKESTRDFEVNADQARLRSLTDRTCNLYMLREFSEDLTAFKLDLPNVGSVPYSGSPSFPETDGIEHAEDLTSLRFSKKSQNSANCASRRFLS